MSQAPLIVIEGGSPAAISHARDELAAAGWPVVERWEDARPGVVCAGGVDSGSDAQQATIAAMVGAGLLLEARAEREVLDLYEDLRRLAPSTCASAIRPPSRTSARTSEHCSNCSSVAPPWARRLKLCTCPGVRPTAGWRRRVAN